MHVRSKTTFLSTIKTKVKFICINIRFFGPLFVDETVRANVLDGHCPTKTNYNICNLYDFENVQ